MSKFINLFDIFFFSFGYNLIINAFYGTLKKYKIKLKGVPFLKVENYKNLEFCDKIKV